MTFKEIIPSPKLQPYIKCFYLYESDSDRGYDDTVFPSGTMEVIFNLGTGNWKSKKDDTFYTTPPIEALSYFYIVFNNNSLSQKVHTNEQRVITKVSYLKQF